MFSFKISFLVGQTSLNCMPTMFDFFENPIQLVLNLGFYGTCLAGKKMW